MGWYSTFCHCNSLSCIHFEHNTINSLWSSDAIWHHRSTSTLVWVVAWWHQTITWTNIDFSSVKFCGIHLRLISQEVLKNLIQTMSSEITILKLLIYLPGANHFIGYRCVIKWIMKCLSTHRMLNCFQGIWIYINILHHSSTKKWWR